MITTSADAPELQPSEFVTVKLYVPAAKPDIVVLIPVPVVTTAPGFRVKVQVPLAGNPLIITLPVATAQVG